MDSPREQIPDRINVALQETSPFEKLHHLLLKMKTEVIVQSEMIQFPDEFRSRHETDSDETIYNSILEVMDFILGFCSPQMKVF